MREVGEIAIQTRPVSPGEVWGRSDGEFTCRRLRVEIATGERLPGSALISLLVVLTSWAWRDWAMALAGWMPLQGLSSVPFGAREVLERRDVSRSHVRIGVATAVVCTFSQLAKISTTPVAMQRISNTNLCTESLPYPANFVKSHRKQISKAP